MTSTEWMASLRAMERGVAILRSGDALSAPLLDELAAEPDTAFRAATWDLDSLVGRERARAVLTAVRARARTLKKERVVAAKAVLRVAEDGEGAPPLSAVLGRAVPEGVRIPRGYRIEADGSVICLVETDDGVAELPVAPRPILATGVLVDEDGHDGLHLEWKSATWRREVVRASLTQDPRAIVGLRDHGAPISHADAKRVCSWLAAQEEASELPRARSSSRLGWQPGGSFLLGREVLGDGWTMPSDAPPSVWRDGYVALDAEDGGARQIVDAIGARGTWEDWCAAVQTIAQYPLVLLSVWASLAAPLLGVIDSAPNAIIDWSGETSHGKTTALRLGASCWGQPDEKRGPLIQKWSSSPGKIEGTAALCQHIPVFLDDTKDAKDKSVIPNVIYQFASGQGRGRALPGGGTRPTMAWRTVLLSTGEDPATSYSQDAGARARVISIRAVPFGDGEHHAEVDALRVALADNYGHAGPRAVRWLLAHRAQWPRIREKYEERRAAYAAAAGGPVGARVAHVMALLEMGGRLAEAIGVPAPIGESPVVAAAPFAESGATEADRASAAMRSLYAHAAQRPTEFWGRHAYDMRDGVKIPRTPSRGWLGAWEDDDLWREIAWVEDGMKRVLRYLGHEPDGILDTWHRRGWLVEEPPHRAKKITVGGGRPRCFVIRREVLER